MVLAFGIGLAALALFLFGGKLLVQLDPKVMAKGIRVGLGIALGGLAAFLFMRGRIDMGSLVALGSAAMFGKGRFAGLFSGFFGGPGAGGWSRARTGQEAPGPDQESVVETAWLVMRLNLASGVMHGEVRQGRFAGRRLADLEPAALFDLLRECGAADAASLPLLEAYLERRLGPDWRQQAPPGADAAEHGTTGGMMSREQAYEVLGLAPGAPEAEIRAAHRRLMRTAHPDHGGSNFLASQINRAKDVLLG
ncbi:DnaJ domain-containing protein [Ferrovibrio sp.]|uniref:DnaJ domain-containing protein n=1 Tax=Ferrovibrio sp. TaxID=1917215 RepID=UPI0025B89449|nr:DnaJ domain-containing protein [Ferrovibrio sp.]